MKKNIKLLFLLQLQKFEKIKWSYFSQFLPPGRVIDFDQSSCLAEIICKEHPCSLNTAFFKLKTNTLQTYCSVLMSELVSKTRYSFPMIILCKMEVQDTR